MILLQIEICSCDFWPIKLDLSGEENNMRFVRGFPSPHLVCINFEHVSSPPPPLPPPPLPPPPPPPPLTLSPIHTLWTTQASPG